jgi:hypothetical protein
MPDPANNHYLLERAKTGRSSCGSCKNKIGQGEIRFGSANTEVLYDSMRFFNISLTLHRFRHLGCVTAKQLANVEDAGGREEIEGWSELDDETQKVIEEMFDARVLAGDPKRVHKKKEPELDDEGNEIIKPKRVHKKKEPELDDEGNEIIKPKRVRKKKEPELDDEGNEIIKPKRVRKKKEPELDEAGNEIIKATPAIKRKKVEEGKDVDQINEELELDEIVDDEGASKKTKMEEKAKIEE